MKLARDFDLKGILGFLPNVMNNDQISKSGRQTTRKEGCVSMPVIDLRPCVCPVDRYFGVVLRRHGMYEKQTARFFPYDELGINRGLQLAFHDEGSRSRWEGEMRSI